MNRNRANTPSRITDTDREYQRAAVARHERNAAARKRRERLARLAVCCISVGLFLAAFYTLTN